MPGMRRMSQPRLAKKSRSYAGETIHPLPTLAGFATAALALGSPTVHLVWVLFRCEVQALLIFDAAGTAVNAALNLVACRVHARLTSFFSVSKCSILFHPPRICGLP